MRFFRLKTNLLLLRIFAAYLVASIILLLIPARVVAPVRHTVLFPLTIAQRALLHGLRAAENACRRAAGLWRSEKEAVLLRGQVAELKGQLVAESERRKAAESRLALLLALPAETRKRAVVAALTAYDISPLRRTATFDKGSSSGVVRNAPVLWHDVVVGRVELVGPWTCQVVLLGDPECRLAVRCARSRVQGVLEGIGGGLCMVKYIPLTQDVRAGDTFITSGVDGIFPAGRLVGECTEATSESGAVFKWIQVKPAFDLARLEHVVILLPEAKEGMGED